MLWRVNNRSLVRFILLYGLSILILSLVISPGTTVDAQQANKTVSAQPVLTDTPTDFPTQTPEPVTGSQAGANAGLVCGAVILVIIIIAGLIRSSRWIPYRGHGDNPEGE